MRIAGNYFVGVVSDTQKSLRPRFPGHNGKFNRKRDCGIDWPAFLIRSRNHLEGTLVATDVANDIVGPDSLSFRLDQTGFLVLDSVFDVREIERLRRILMTLFRDEFRKQRIVENIGTAAAAPGPRSRGQRHRSSPGRRQRRAVLPPAAPQAGPTARRAAAQSACSREHCFLAVLRRRRGELCFGAWAQTVPRQGQPCVRPLRLVCPC